MEFVLFLLMYKGEKETNIGKESREIFLDVFEDFISRNTSWI